MSFSGDWKTRKECCYGQGNPAAPMKNTIVFEISGYAYRTIPVWFDENGSRMMNLNFKFDFNKLTYIYTFYKKETDDICKMTFHLSTSDDVIPTIYETISGKKMNVVRHTVHNSYVNWKVTC